MDGFDKIIIEDLRIDCLIGVNKDERSKKQTLIINVGIFADLSKPSQTDSLNDTIDYSRIYNNIVQLVENSKFHLLERLATKVAELCLDFEKVQKVRVKIQKPNALPRAKSASIEIELSK